MSRRRGDPSRLGLDGLLWVVIVASTPIHQLIYVLVTPNIRLVAVAAAAASLLLARFQAPRMQPLFLVASAMVLIAGGVSGTNSKLLDSWIVAISFALMLALVPGALMFQARRYPSFLRIAVTSAVVVQTISSTAGIFQAAGFAIFGVDARGGRVNGLAYHPNVLGLMAALAILVLFDAWRRQAFPKWILLVALALNGFAMAATASLSSLLALAAGACLYLARMESSRRLAIIALSALVVVGATIATAGNPLDLIPGFSDRVDEVTGASADEGVASFLVRLETYTFALNYISHDPVVGVGMDPTNQGTVTASLVVHNYLLRGWYQGGLLLFLALLLLTVGLFWISTRGMLATELTAPSAVILACIAFALTSAFYTQAHYWTPIFLAVVAISIQLPPRARETGIRGSLRGLSP